MTRPGDQITTNEELDALPIKTIVMDAHGRGFQKFTFGWEATGLTEAHSTVARPATALHIPGYETRSPFDADCETHAVEISERLKAQGDWAGSIQFRMYLCPHCGSKRCPKAQDCTQPCPYHPEGEQS